jgi:tetratricopeptide (TPR) repeat protein
VDGHPLVREHFGAALEKSSPDVWKQAHSRLFDYFCTIPDKDQPDGEAGLLPLYQSLHHGVAAGRAQEALFHIYYQRIDRNGRGYGTHQLSLFSTELAAFAAFFPGGWQTPVQEVSREAQGYLLNLAGFGLRALGRLKEAQTPFERNIALNIELEDYLHAAADSDNLSELLFERGELQAALKRSNDTVELIDRTTKKMSSQPIALRRPMYWPSWAKWKRQGRCSRRPSNSRIKKSRSCTTSSQCKASSMPLS